MLAVGAGRVVLDTFIFSPFVFFFMQPLSWSWFDID